MDDNKSASEKGRHCWIKNGVFYIAKLVKPDKPIKTIDLSTVVILDESDPATRKHAFRLDFTKEGGGNTFVSFRATDEESADKWMVAVSMGILYHRLSTPQARESNDDEGELGQREFEFVSLSQKVEPTAEKPRTPLLGAEIRIEIEKKLNDEDKENLQLINQLLKDERSAGIDGDTMDGEEKSPSGNHLIDALQPLEKQLSQLPDEEDYVFSDHNNEHGNEARGGDSNVNEDKKNNKNSNDDNVDNEQTNEHGQNENDESKNGNDNNVGNEQTNEHDQNDENENIDDDNNGQGKNEEQRKSSEQEVEELENIPEKENADQAFKNVKGILRQQESIRRAILKTQRKKKTPPPVKPKPKLSTGSTRISQVVTQNSVLKKYGSLESLPLNKLHSYQEQLEGEKTAILKCTKSMSQVVQEAKENLNKGRTPSENSLSEGEYKTVSCDLERLQNQLMVVEKELRDVQKHITRKVASKGVGVGSPPRVRSGSGRSTPDATSIIRSGSHNSEPLQTNNPQLRENRGREDFDDEHVDSIII